MKIHYLVTLLVAWLIFPVAVHATAQFPDKIIYQGQEEPLFINPLEQYFDQGHMKPNIFMDGVISSACWRGYIATWKIIKNNLYLKKIEKEYYKEKEYYYKEGYETELREIPLSELFPQAKDSVHAVWYSGTLRIPQGKRLRYVHMGYASVYEREIHIKISKGIVQKIEEIDNTNSPDLNDPDIAWKEAGNFTGTGGVDPEIAASDNTRIAEMEENALEVEQATERDSTSEPVTAPDKEQCLKKHNHHP